MQGSEIGGRYTIENVIYYREFKIAGNHPDSGIETRSPALQADSLPTEL